MAIKEILNWHQSAIPNPTKDNQRVILGVHFEECSEMLETIHMEYGDIISLKPAVAHNYLTTLADTLKKNKEVEVIITDRKELLDSLADQIVTAIGVGYMHGFDILGAIAEVSRSNDSKFVDGKPIFDINGKIAKGPNYFKPNLEPFLGTDPTI